MQLEYFELSEFDCKCDNCDRENNIDLNFVKRLDRSRDSAATPYVISSGYRCAQHPLSIKRPTSSHRHCAADIAATDSHSRFLILRALMEHGFTRIGIGEDFIHVDGDEQKPDRLVWTYYPENDL